MDPAGARRSLPRAAVPGSVEIIGFPAMVGTGAYPSPIRFGRGEDMNPNGFADHFPIGMVIHET